MKITTKLMAKKLGVKDQTMRAAHCRQGHYLGLVPIVLPNGLLRWDDQDADRVLAGESPVGGNIRPKHVNTDRSAKARAAAVKSVAARRAKREAAEVVAD